MYVCNDFICMQHLHVYVWNAFSSYVMFIVDFLQGIFTVQRSFLLFQVTSGSFSSAFVNMLVQLGVNAMKYAGRFFSTKQPCIPGISLIWYNAKYSVCSWIWFTNTRFRILVSDSGVQPLVCGARLLTSVTLILWSELESSLLFLFLRLLQYFSTVSKFGKWDANHREVFWGWKQLKQAERLGQRPYCQASFLP